MIEYGRPDLLCTGLRCRYINGMRSIVFSDVDGTLLNSSHRISNVTLESIRSLGRRGIPFVIVSARSPSGIFPIFRRYGFRTPIIAHSGALIIDEDGKVLFHKGISKDKARSVISFMESEKMDLAYNIFSYDKWYVRDKSDARIMNEECIVEAEAEEGSVDSVTSDSISKIFCICDPEMTDSIELRLKDAFGDLSIVKSDDHLIEIMAEGVSKANAAGIMCRHYGLALEDAVAFGDNYNDEEMLHAVGHGFLMGNAPQPLRERVALHADDNDHDGIAKALVGLALA